MCTKKNWAYSSLIYLMGDCVSDKNHSLLIFFKHHIIMLIITIKYLGTSVSYHFSRFFM
jgi:hypothetical protein